MATKGHFRTTRSANLPKWLLQHQAYLSTRSPMLHSHTSSRKTQMATGKPRNSSKRLSCKDRPAKHKARLEKAIGALIQKCLFTKGLAMATARHRSEQDICRSRIRVAHQDMDRVRTFEEIQWFCAGQAILCHDTCEMIYDDMKSIIDECRRILCGHPYPSSADMHCPERAQAWVCPGPAVLISTSRAFQSDSKSASRPHHCSRPSSCPPQLHSSFSHSAVFPCIWLSGTNVTSLDFNFHSLRNRL
jgi:hypothetical protein